ncbi:MAG TPA: aldo/keto reductase [Clostridia bacterium]|nr:aldo/keto reductase [Clostridia bacterium]HPQ47198.1 aldo/keto reductase [Clostridia bacterium]
MKSLTDTFELRNGSCIPCIGFGTWQMPDDDTGYKAVRKALEAGYRHIDTASIYKNEETVGRAIIDSGVPRSEIFLTSKLWGDDYGYESTKRAFEKSLELLHTGYLDLYLMHWPNPVKFRNNWKKNNADTWKAIEELYEEGKIKSIGVSNFMIHHLEELKKTASIMPMVNQIKLCPGDTKDELVSYCRENGILVEAYSPLGTGKVFKVPELIDLASKYNVTVAQLSIRWSLQMGYLPLPKSVTPEYISNNADVFSFKISDDDVNKIAGLTNCCGVPRNPDEVPW